MNFSTNYQDVIDQIGQIDPVRYAKTRNYGDGAVTRLSPYISRGMISTRQIHQAMLERGFKNHEMEKFVQELAWRDYWQQVWVAKGDEIDHDLRREQPEVENHEMPRAIADAKTGISAIDEGIRELYESGYMHNHMRMYVASITCNVAGSHWKIPAKWLYYNLLDGDWASNGLSWQWVAGANANKKYIANQENINKYFNSDQKGTFLDVSYEKLPEIDIPEILRDTFQPELKTNLPDSTLQHLDREKTTLVYNYYNLDPKWHEGEDCNRVLLLEPSYFRKYPVADQCIEFIKRLSENISGIKIFTGEFDQLIEQYDPQEIIYKEHPAARHYQGKEESRDWMFQVTGYYRSFFAFWKKCTKKKSNAREAVA